MCLYDGSGALAFEGDASFVAAAPGRVEIALAPSNGFTMRIVNTSVDNPLRNVRVVPAAFEANYTAQTFSPAFLQLLQGVLQLAGGRCLCSRLPCAVNSLLRRIEVIVLILSGVCLPQISCCEAGTATAKGTSHFRNRHHHCTVVCLPRRRSAAALQCLAAQ